MTKADQNNDVYALPKHSDGKVAALDLDKLGVKLIDPDRYRY